MEHYPLELVGTFSSERLEERFHWSTTREKNCFPVKYVEREWVFSFSHSGKLLRFSTELPFVFYVQGRMAGLDSNDTQLELWMPSIQCFSFVPLIFNWYLVKKHSDIGAHKFLIQDERSQPAEKIRHPSSFQPQNWALGDELLPLERWLVWCPLNSLGIHQECALAPMSGPELIGMKLARVPG
jgi:hypothetical protein